MDPTTVEVSDDSSSYSFVQISSDLSDSELEMSYEELMEKELKTTHLKLQESEQEIEKLKSETATKNIALATERKRVVDLDTDRRQLHVQIRSLCNMVTNQENDIDRLLLNKTYLESQVRDMKDHIEKSDAEKLELERKEIELQHEINELKTDLFKRGESIEVLETELVNRGECIEALKKGCEMHKQRSDKLMEEKDELTMDDLYLIIGFLIVCFVLNIGILIFSKFG